MSSNHTHNKKNQTLTKNQRIVLNLLQDSGEPLKAYFILDSLKKRGSSPKVSTKKILLSLTELFLFDLIEYFICFFLNKDSILSILSICLGIMIKTVTEQ